MTDTVNVSIRMDRQLKAQADEFFAQVGLTMSTAVGVFVRQCLAKNRVPFEIEGDPFYSPSNMAVLRESITQAERGEVVTKTMAELEAMAR